MASYNDHNGISYTASAFRYGAAPTQKIYFNIYGDNRRVWRSSKAAYLPESNPQATWVKRSGGGLWGWTHFGYGDSGEWGTRILFDHGANQGIYRTASHTDTFLNRIIYIDFWHYKVETLTDATGRLPRMVDGSSDCYDYEVFSGMAAANYPTSMGFYSGDGGGGNYDAVWASGDHQLTFWVDPNAGDNPGDLLCEYEYSGIDSEHHLVLAYKVKFSPRVS